MVCLVSEYTIFRSESQDNRMWVQHEATMIIFDKNSKISRENILPKMEKSNTSTNEYYENARHYIQMINEERGNAMVK